MSDPLVEDLRKHFRYDCESGLLVRLTNRGKVKAGDIVGSFDDNGYLRFYFKGFNLKVHRVCWALHYGSFPNEYIDHINCVKDDNRISNLREAKPSENMWNMKITKRNNSGVKGVSWHSATNMWRAVISKNGKSKHLGLYNSIEKAKEAIVNYREYLHGEFANDGI